MPCQKSIETAGEKVGTVDSITLHRDPQSDEWVFDLSPGLDLLEVARVLGVVQQQALHLLQQQLHASPTTPEGKPLPLPNSSTGEMTQTNQFAQL